MWQKLRLTILNQLKQGASPRELAMACTLGAVIGLFPVFGATTTMCFVVGTKMRLNQPLMQLVNYALSPIHLLMMPVFLKLGGWIFGGPQIIFDYSLIKSDWDLGIGNFLGKYGIIFAQGVFAWILIAPIFGAILFLILKPVFVKLKSK